MLEALITKDPRWCWILEEWETSSNKELVSLSETVHRFRENFVMPWQYSVHVAPVDQVRCGDNADAHIFTPLYRPIVLDHCDQTS
jgi:hypothetical protein